MNVLGVSDERTPDLNLLLIVCARVSLPVVDGFRIY